MPNPYGAPEISVQEVAERLKNDENIVILDVRERIELLRAKLEDEQFTLVPLSQLSQLQFEALPEFARDKEQELVIMCHHGVRSAQVTAWLLHHGWKNVLSMAGGIDAYARDIDPTIGFY